MASLTEKITIAEAHEWLRVASKSWGLTAHEAESFADDMTSLRPKDFKAPKAKRGPNKNSLTLEERRDAPYDASKCDAGVYVGPGGKPGPGGFRVQCKCKAEGLCKTHQKVVDKNGMPRDGYYNQERPAYPFNDESQPQTPWEGVEVVKKKRGRKTSGGERKETTCGHCGEIGHNKRTCPNKNNKSEDEEADLLKKLEALRAKKCAEKENEKKEIESETEPEPESSTNEILDGDDTDYSDKTISVDDEDDDETIDCSFEGVEYVRDNSGTVFDMPDMDPVGTWNEEGECIDFDTQALKAHKAQRDPSYN